MTANELIEELQKIASEFPNGNDLQIVTRDPKSYKDYIYQHGSHEIYYPLKKGVEIVNVNGHNYVLIEMDGR